MRRSESRSRTRHRLSCRGSVSARPAARHQIRGTKYDEMQRGIALNGRDRRLKRPNELGAKPPSTGFVSRQRLGYLGFRVRVEENSARHPRRDQSRARTSSHVTAELGSRACSARRCSISARSAPERGADYSRRRRRYPTGPRQAGCALPGSTSEVRPTGCPCNAAPQETTVLVSPNSETRSSARSSMETI